MKFLTQDSQISAAAGMVLRHGFGMPAALALVGTVAVFWIAATFIKRLNQHQNISKNCETTR